MTTGPRKLAARLVLLSAALGACGGDGGGRVGADAPGGGIQVSWKVPPTLGDTTLADAANFAWNEFIALNWPAVAQTGQPNTRDMPDTTAHFGDPSHQGPLVWHTYRSKIEIFPPVGSQPNGYTTDSTTSYGYDAAPQYTYASAIGPASGTGNDSTPWINLDENDEIGLDAMYAGVGSGLGYTNGLILFTAKANRPEYSYVAANQFFVPAIAGPAKAASAQFIVDSLRSPPPGGSTIASLPTGTIELKAAWRQLTQAEADSGRFYQTRVRYYRPGAGGTTYVDTVFGLVALHIIHKTPDQPYFVFATFEQADNILTADGARVEDENGNLNPGYDTLPPMDTVISATPAQNPAPNGYSEQNIQQLSPATSNSVPGQRIYYRNTPGGPETHGVISVNRRVHGIPQTIITANQSAHEAMAAYATANSLPAAVWQYYKLVNVQYAPIDKEPGVLYTGADSATYYQANIVVETDHNLQTFSGQFQPPFSGGETQRLITDWCGSNASRPVAGCPAPPGNQANGPFHNVYYNGSGYNMGGCMGCHGNAQVAGGDFSFLLIEGNNAAPQVADPVAAPMDTDKFLRIFSAARGARASPAAGQ